jgi:NAD(P)-dependent dehydrogenase (short-subunit alcohol dehydrogenase family)
MERLLEGKTALVTGASKGVGKGIALEFARQGCQVAVNYNSDAAGAGATVREIEALGGQAFAVKGNVGDSQALNAMFDAVFERFPRLDVLVNNAGVQTWCSLLDLSEAEWDRVLDTNLKGCFLGTQRAARTMQHAGCGSIINIGSGCNKVAFPKLVNYTASKGGIEQFTKVAAVELGPLGIRVNCVAPGAIEIERTITEEAGGSYADTWAKLTPLKRVGLPVDVGRACVFFASDLSAFVTGQTLWVDGGLFTMPQWPYD